MPKLKQYLIYFFAFVIIIFIIPALCTKQARETVVDVNTENTKQQERRKQ